MKIIRLLIAVIAAVSLFSAFGVLFAAGLSTNFSDVYVDNLKIGGVYNLTKTVNYPMWVMQKGGGKVEISIETTIPSPIDLREGYEAIPDKSWVTYSRTNMALLSGETGNVDVTINIPGDRKYMGKKYMAHVFITGMPSKEQGGVAIALGIKGKVFISIAPDPLTEKEQQEMKTRRSAPQGIIIVPEKFYSESSAGAASIKVTEYEPLKLINPSKETLDVTLETADPDVTGYSAPEGYQKGKLSDLVFSKSKTAIKPDGVGNIDITLKTADKGLKLFYVIRINVKSQRMNISKFVPVYLN